MKVFDINQDQRWGDKYNFVDRNNTVVGYDMNQSCCESAGYCITKKLPDRETLDTFPCNGAPSELTIDELEPYTFVKTLKPIENLVVAHENGGSVTFKLTNSGKAPIYLTLYNIHNGYYSHGFEVEVKGKQVMTGSI